MFEAPWESRAFGITVVLNKEGRYEWRDFHTKLAAETNAADRGDSPLSYYERWLASLEKLLIEKGMVTLGELEARTAEYASGQRDEDHHD